MQLNVVTLCLTISLFIFLETADSWRIKRRTRPAQQQQQQLPSRLDFNVRCHRYAVNRAVISVHLWAVDQTFDPARTSVQLSLEASLPSGRTMYKYYSVSVQDGEVDLVLPRWALEKNVEAEVCLVSAKTGAHLSHPQHYKFASVCGVEADGSDESQEVSGGPNKPPARPGAPAFPPPNQPPRQTSTIRPKPTNQLDSSWF